MIYETFCLNTSVLITVSTITGHPYALHVTFPPLGQLYVFLFLNDTEFDSSQNMCFKCRRIRPEKAMNLIYRASQCFERLDAIPLLLLLSR